MFFFNCWRIDRGLNGSWIKGFVPVSVIQQNVVHPRFTTPLGKRLNLRMLQQKTLKSLKNVFFC